jgi:two-component system sensor histidine kinase DesK
MAENDTMPGRERPAASKSMYFAPIIWLIWLLYLVQPIASLFQSRPSAPQIVLTLAGAVVFIALYVWVALRSVRSIFTAPLDPAPSAVELWLPIAGMFVLALLETRANGYVWGALFVYTCAAAGGRLPIRQALALVVGIELLILFYGLRDDLSTAETVSALVTILLASVTTILMVWAVRTFRRIQEERQEMGRIAAIAEERLRIARDLHDLLGHNLSLIALKSELAHRLIHTAPDRAEAEIADVESVARTALQEVRETVASYRRPTLIGELHAAREILAAAGIAYTFAGDDRVAEGQPPTFEEALAWAVREGVTNVIRHSRARTCRVLLLREAAVARLTITDDGTAVSDDAVTAMPQLEGSGLRGLAERISALGGVCDYGPQPSGGYRLAVALPLAQAHLPDAHAANAAADRSVWRDPGAQATTKEANA